MFRFDTYLTNTFTMLEPKSTAQPMPPAWPHTGTPTERPQGPQQEVEARSQPKRSTVGGVQSPEAGHASGKGAGLCAEPLACGLHSYFSVREMETVSVPSFLP